MMDTADAIHLATALIYSVDEFHTRDDKRKGPKVPLVSLYQWSGEPAICNQYPLQIRSPASDQPMLELKGEADGQKKRPPKGD